MKTRDRTRHPQCASIAHFESNTRILVALRRTRDVARRQIDARDDAAAKPTGNHERQAACAAAHIQDSPGLGHAGEIDQQWRQPAAHLGFVSVAIRC